MLTHSYKPALQPPQGCPRCGGVWKINEYEDQECRTCGNVNHSYIPPKHTKADGLISGRATFAHYVGKYPNLRGVTVRTEAQEKKIGENTNVESVRMNVWCPYAECGELMQWKQSTGGKYKNRFVRSYADSGGHRIVMIQDEDTGDFTWR